MQKNKGFTLIELMVTIVVLAIVTMMAAPTFNSLILNQNLTKSSRNLYSLIMEARAQAVLVRQDVKLEIVEDQEEYIERSDEIAADAALKKQRESKLLYLWGPTGKSILSGTETSITFEMTGKVKGASSDTIIVICDEADGDKSKTITITKMGSLQPISEGDC
ncbi:prepilin-type N-terminal cleavage/methylation domain-containing protein [Acinetobacter sp. RF15A]|uniref:GspH/FimT family pseudopilin n=1 Tax=unclassified Acinetobacter TaxID=196816 RepID=UPI0011977272|nr:MULTISPECIES: GspH/FimT family pseudopilin [unclassified Acinetobacter]TSH77364.1 prepilin-type N-terminal cleavage/methylation domain-containing protein [Acinetobacter sp. RF15A]TSI19301.1 prepilin-type N-terminal cleavage/methylation domain-containing protein [Acinetobacter sp. RF15B]